MKPTDDKALIPANEGRSSAIAMENCTQIHASTISAIAYNRMDPDHLMPLHYLLRLDEYRFKDRIQTLLENGNINVNYVYPHSMKTLLEVACCEGRVESVRLLLDSGADVNRLNDVHNRAPIHFATEAGHADVLQVLLQDEQCDPDLEIEKKSALHFAVGNDSIDCVKLLLDYGANPNIVNLEGLTPIHIAAMRHNGAIVESILKMSIFPPNLDDFHDFKDGGKATTRQILEKKLSRIELPPARKGKMDMDKDRRFFFKAKESDFLEYLGKINKLSDVFDRLIQIAAKRNFPAAIRELLRKEYSDLSSIAKARRTAVWFGCPRVLQEILPALGLIPADIPVHEACRALGRLDGNRDDRYRCFRLIFEHQEIDLGWKDQNGNTPLHYAARAGSNEAIGWLLELGCSLEQRNNFNVPAMTHISLGTLWNLFDNCIYEVHEMEKSLQIHFDYRYLISCMKPSEESGSNNRPKDTAQKMSECQEMKILACIVENHALHPLLNHPLLSSFLFLKWCRIKYFAYANFAFYATFCVLITFYILSINHKMDLLSSPPPKSSNSTSTIPHTIFQQYTVLGSLTAIFVILLAMREIYQVIASPRQYVWSCQNICEFVVVGLSVWTLVAPNPLIEAILLLLSAWELVILIGLYFPMPAAGIEMFKIVTWKFIQLLSLYGVLIVGFALAFLILFCNTKDDDNFLDIGHSLFKTVVMFTGEFDASDIPFVSHPVFGRFVFLLFVFLIAIIMLNHLNGLAVSDTADVLQRSKIVDLISYVELIRYFEGLNVGWELDKIGGRWFPKTDVRPSPLSKPLEWIGMRTRLFPKCLPEKRMYVTPYESNKIIIYDETEPKGYYIHGSMDSFIVEKAREGLWRQNRRRRC